jgi:hypothetical protein
MRGCELLLRHLVVPRPPQIARRRKAASELLCAALRSRAVGPYAAVRFDPRDDRFAFAGYFTASAATTTARSAAFTASELPKRANSSAATIATAKDRRAFSAYLPRGSRLALEKSTSGSLLERDAVFANVRTSFRVIRLELSDADRAHREDTNMGPRPITRAGALAPGDVRHPFGDDQCGRRFT